MVRVIRIQSDSNAHDRPWRVAVEKGFFAAEGLEVEYNEDNPRGVEGRCEDFSQRWKESQLTQGALEVYPVCEWGAIERVHSLGKGKIIAQDTTFRTGAIMVRKRPARSDWLARGAASAATAALFLLGGCQQPPAAAPTSPPKAVEAPAKSPVAGVPAASQATPVQAREASPVPASAASPVPAAASNPEVESFFRGRTIRVVVGNAAGGGFDNTARMVARHLGSHIPGSPQVIVENMPGGGGLVAANFLYNTAPKDGATLGLFHEAQVLNQVTGGEGVQFDARKFAILGSSFNDSAICFTRADSGIGSMQDAQASPQPIIIGATGPGANSFDVPVTVAAATGAKFKVVPGYPGSNDIRIAIERGEVQGACLAWETLKSQTMQWFTSGFVRPLVQSGLTRNPDLPELPVALEFARDDEAKALLRLLAAPGEIAKPFVLPPGAPPARVQALQAALAETYRDPAFLAEAKTAKLDFTPKSPQQVAGILDEVLATPPDVARRYRQITNP